MNRGDLAFKLGVSVVSIAELIGLLYLGVFGAVQEYDPVHQETIGLTLILLASGVACAVFLVIAFLAMKWKGTAVTDAKSTETSRV